MKILMVQRFDITNVGCAERIWRQAEGLIARGHEVTLINYPHTDRRQRFPALRTDSPPGAQLIELDRSSSALWKNTHIISDLIKQQDLIHLWKAYPDTALPVLWSRRNIKIPLHYDWDDLEGGSDGIAERLTGSPTVGRLLTYWESEIVRNQADTITVASQELHKRALALGFPQNSLFPGGVGAVENKSQPELKAKWQELFFNRKILVFLGQLEADDLPVCILDSYRKIAQQYPDSLLCIVGDGTGRQQLEQYAIAHGLSKQLLFTGYLPFAEAQEILAQATLFLFPLTDEPMTRAKSPLVVVEAMAHGIPIIGSNVGEVPHMLGEDGILLNDLDPDSWSNAIGLLLANETERKIRGDKLHQRFQQSWTWDHHVDMLEQAYQQALEKVR